jgi:hypothetical protein
MDVRKYLASMQRQIAEQAGVSITDVKITFCDYSDEKGEDENPWTITIYAESKTARKYTRVECTASGDTIETAAEDAIGFRDYYRQNGKVR